MGTTTGSDDRIRRPRRIIPWLAGAGIAGTFAMAAMLLLLETLSYFDDDTYTPTPTPAPEFVAGAAVVALIACLPRLSSRVRAWGWSLAGAAAYLGISTADRLADGSFLASPVLPVLAALTGGAIFLAGVLLAYARACARSAGVPAA
jgi:drug/metabolite transporter (DMT)-like permease